MTKQEAQDKADSLRRSVRAHELILTLQECVLNGRELSAQQIRAAEILLKKTVPDLQAIALSNGGEGPLQVQWLP